MPNVSNLRLGPNAIYIPLTCIGVSRWGFALGLTQILKFELGVLQILAFLDTNMLV